MSCKGVIFETMEKTKKNKIEQAIAANRRFSTSGGVIPQTMPCELDRL